MNYQLHSTPDENEEKQILDGLWKHNDHFAPADIQPLRITLKDESGDIKGGIIARTWWGGLDIQYLWVAAEYQRNGVGRELMQMAEREAIERGCHFSYVDTFSFQARGFYIKLGYSEYGSLDGFSLKFSRHYLVKQLV
ncbi:GNAT family N-acetyltransferase [Symbiopectobacterium purcellii]|uniref:GNAT family N-acetyltransferase n=1 Tax=Symbiopectobacterium purcellii TaxID=2871826 RepID=A0ABX9AGE8_9ENTR|nr:GNAT family N-acetyltransferase [Symbiopectobacterium purcellii]QZN94232.1 GNAT family N-acetyltransferase [Symbiopectobacterium purcellii]